MQPVVYRVLPCRCHKVSSYGDVFTRLHQFSKRGVCGIITQRSYRWARMRGSVTTSGYLQVAIHGESIRVNRLVALSFIPNPLNYPEVQHRNGIKTQNDVSNLKWGNQAHNAADRETHGHTAIGIKNASSKLTDKKVLQILTLRNMGETLQSLADKFSVSKKLILLIIQNKIWKHVKR